MDKSIVPANQIAVRSSICYELLTLNGAEKIKIKDDSVENVERHMEDLKLDYQFNEKYVPQFFKTLINSRMNRIEEIWLKCLGSECLLEFDNFHIRFEKKNEDWTVTYEKVNKTIKTDDPEKSIIDHLWFVLKNPNVKLNLFTIFACEVPKNRRKLNSKKLTKLLQSMFDSIDHQIQTKNVSCHEFNEDVFLSMLKHVKPGTLEEITCDISWKEEGNHQKMEEIVGTDQWKQANKIFSFGITPLKIDDLSRCEMFWLERDIITPEGVLLITKHIFNSVGTRARTLSCKKKQFDIDAVFDFLRSQNDGTEIIKTKLIDPDAKFSYNIVRSGRSAFMFGNENSIAISSAPVNVE